MRAAWAILLVVPPLLALVASAMQQAEAPEVQAPAAPEARAGQATPAQGPRPRACPREEGGVVDEELDTLELALAERHYEEAQWRSLVELALEECEIDMEILALSCEDIPCLLVVEPAETRGRWATFGSCPPLADTLEGRRPVPWFKRTVTCGDGGEVEVEGTWFSDGGPDLTGQVESAVLEARQEKIARQILCGGSP